MLRLNKLSAVTMAITVALAACSEGTGLNDEPFDPGASAADLQVVQGAFSAAVFESLALSSESFNLVSDTGAVPSALLQASLAAGSAGSRWEAAAAAEAFAAAGPASGPLVPVDFLGRTYDRGVDGYEHDAARTDAPANGVRFILYEVDPITRAPGDTEIGYVDLSMTFVDAFPLSTATVDYLLSVPTRDFDVDATAVFTFNSETLAGSINVEGTFMQGAHTVGVAGVIEFNEGELPSEGGTIEIHVDGHLFAVVTISGETITVQNGEGGELTSAEREAVRGIFDGLEDLFEERFEDFIRPVAWMFGA